MENSQSFLHNTYSKIKKSRIKTINQTSSRNLIRVWPILIKLDKCWWTVCHHKLSKLLRISMMNNYLICIIKFKLNRQTKNKKKPKNLRNQLIIQKETRRISLFPLQHTTKSLLSIIFLKTKKNSSKHQQTKAINLEEK